MSDESSPRRTILVPLDLTPAGEVKIPVAQEYARALCADVLLLHVLRPGALHASSVSPSEALARTYLDTFGARLRGAGIHAEGVIRTGAPGPTIVQEALIRDAYLIILGTNTRPILSTAVLGSVADHVARMAPCPVMFVHPRGETVERQHLRCFHEDAERAGLLVQRDLYGARADVNSHRIIDSELQFFWSATYLVTIHTDHFDEIDNVVMRGRDGTPTAAVELLSRPGNRCVGAGGPWSGIICPNWFCDHDREGDDGVEQDFAGQHRA